MEKKFISFANEMKESGMYVQFTFDFNAATPFSNVRFFYVQLLNATRRKQTYKRI